MSTGPNTPTTCAQCRYWDRLNGDRGECRKRAPKRDRHGNGRWPVDGETP